MNTRYSPHIGIGTSDIMSDECIYKVHGRVRTLSVKAIISHHRRTLTAVSLDQRCRGGGLVALRVVEGVQVV